MRFAPRLDSIEGRLTHALRQFMPSPEIARVWQNDSHIEGAVKSLLENKEAWLATVPALQDVQDWVEAHWDTERQRQPPMGTVPTGDEYGNQRDVQLDTLTATFKLLLASARHGATTVAEYAMGFAAHGMIEVRSFYLLKGPSVSNATPLDEYCSIFPYREAFQTVNAESYLDPTRDLGWPPATADNVCALEVRSFERRECLAFDTGSRTGRFERHVSRLLQCGPGTLALILGLVWSTGFRVFGHWHSISAGVAATLPFFHTGGSGGGVSQALLALPGLKRPSTNRPLNVAELVEVVHQYAALPERTKHVLDLAMRRLRDSSERIELEDKVIDVCIALEALFMEIGEYNKQHDSIARRGSWHFADSLAERDQTRTVLRTFYRHRSEIVHGNTSASPTLVEEDEHRGQLAALLADVENMARTSLKTMISEGRPQDWDDCKDPQSIRHDPPRAETEIPAVKSDSLSWSVKEQKEIDQALEAVWRPTVDNAPEPLADAIPVSHQGIDAEAIRRCRQQGIPYVISVPIRLYMAHPKWPKQQGDPFDERTKYYCNKDVERHLRSWHGAAAEKRIYQFELPLEEPDMYLPEAFDMWRQILQQGEQP